MASFIPNITDDSKSFNTSVGSPDFGFLQQNLYKSNQQYEQGLSQIKQDYSTITSAPLTNGENIDKRNEYVSQIQEGLKKVAPTDVSLPQNVQQAEQLYAPFWKDEDLLYDMSKTKSIQNEFQKAESARTSDKDEVRSTYDPASLGPINNARTQLYNAKRGDGSISKVNVPQWTPFINLDKDVSDWKIKDKPEISWTDNYHTDPNTGKQIFDPEHLYTHYNGPKTLNAWTTMVNRQIGDRANPQFNVLGSNLYNNELANYNQANPNADPNDAKKAVLSKYFQPIMEQKGQILDRYNAEVSGKQQQLEELQKAQSVHPNGLTKKQIDIMNGLKSDISQLQLEISPLQTSYSNFSKILNQQNYTDSYVTDQLATLLKGRAVQNYAEGFAAETKSEVKEDTAYFAAQSHNDRLAELRELHSYHEGELKNKQQELNINYLKAVGEYPELFGPQSGQSTIPGSTVAGAATTELQHLTVPEMWMRAKEFQKHSIGANLFGNPLVEGGSKYGPFSQILMNSDVGLTPTELNTLNRIQLANQDGTLNYNSDGKFIPQSVQEGQLYNSAVSKIMKVLGISVKNRNTPDDVTKMIIDYGKNYIGSNVANGTNLEQTKYFANLYNATDRVYNNLQQDLDAHGKMMAAEVTKYPEGYEHIAVKNPNGGYHLISQRDLAPFTFDMSVRGEDGKEYHYSEHELAQKYLKGQVSVHYPSGDSNYNPYIMIDGQEVHPLNVAGRDYQHEFEMQHPTVLGKWAASEGILNTPRVNPLAKGDVIHRIEQMQNHFGRSSDIASDMQNLSTNVIPHAEFYKQGTGSTPVMINIPITGNKFEKNTGYLSDALQPGNRFGVEDTEGQPVAKTETIDKLQSLADDPSISKYIGKTQRVVISDNYGTPKMVIHVKGGLDQSDPYYALSGKTFYVNVNPDTKSELLQKFPTAQNAELYDPLYSNHVDDRMVPTPTMAKSLGIDAPLTPMPTGKGFIIQGNYKSVDSHSGQEINKSIYVPIEGNKTATEARAIQNATIDTLIGRYYSELNTYNIRNGVKVQ